MDFLLKADFPWVDVSGKWNLEMELPDGSIHRGEMRLPGTTALYWLDIEKKNLPAEDPLEIARRSVYNTKREEGFLTEKYPFSGKILLSRNISVDLKDNERAILYLERTRITRVWVDGAEIKALSGTENSLVAAHIYDLTPVITGTEQELKIEVSNAGYPTKGGHMTSPDTQTNWCGITGTMKIFKEKSGLKISRIYADALTGSNEGQVTVIVNNPGTEEEPGTVRVRITHPEKESGEDAEQKLLNEDNEPDGNPYRNEVIIDEVEIEGAFPPGESEHRITIRPKVSLPEELLFWDEADDPARLLHHMTCTIISSGISQVTYSCLIGFRRFTTEKRALLLNGHPVFLRGKHDGMVFPLTGAAPADTASWLKVMRKAKEYGINHYRFHTCCPPDAAFEAADKLGIMMCPELPFWGTIHGKEDPEYNADEQEYLIREGERMLTQFGHHPSFVMLSLGNELWGSAERLGEIIRRLKKIRKDILMTQGSNNFQFMPCILPEDDYFSGVRFSKNRLIRGSYAMCDAPLGPVQTEEPGTDWDYDDVITGKTDEIRFPMKEAETGVGDITGCTADESAEASDNPEVTAASENSDNPGEGKEIEIQFGTGVKKVSASDASAEDKLVPEVPVISHETGQYAMYPDIRRENKYTGVLRADYFSIYRERLKEKGLENNLTELIRDSGRLAVQCYKMEIEAALRSKELSGFQLLDLQDFPGQGGAFVGVLDAFMDEKCVDYDEKKKEGTEPLIRAEEWRQFCGPTVLLARIPRFVWTEGETIPIRIDVRQMDRFHMIGKDTLTVKLIRADMINNIAGGGPGELYKESVPVVLDHIGLDKAAELSICLMPEKLMCAGSYLNEPKMLPRFKIVLETERTKLRNEYEIWILPENPEYSDENEVRRMFMEKEIQIAGTKEEYETALQRGGRILYLPEEIENGIKGDYPSDFWCYPMFRSISESMGRAVPVGTLGISVGKASAGNAFRAVNKCIGGSYKGFHGSNLHSTPGWYKLITHSTPVVLDGSDVNNVVRMIDNMERNHDLGLIFEYGIDGGDAFIRSETGSKVLVCTAPLLQMTGYPEIRMLLKNFLEYMASNDFKPPISRKLSQPFARR